MGKLEDVLDMPVVHLKGDDGEDLYFKEDDQIHRERQVWQIRQIFLDLIGPDERIEYHELPGVITRNELREELRKKVEKL